MTVRELLSSEIGASAEDLDDLFSAFGTAGIEVIDAEDERFAGLDKIPGEKEFKEIPEGVSYAAPSFAPLAISPFDVIFNDLTIRGFSIGTAVDSNPMWSLDSNRIRWSSRRSQHRRKIRRHSLGKRRKLASSISRWASSMRRIADTGKRHSFFPTIRTP